MRKHDTHTVAAALVVAALWLLLMAIDGRAIIAHDTPLWAADSAEALRRERCAIAAHTLQECEKCAPCVDDQERGDQ